MRTICKNDDYITSYGWSTKLTEQIVASSRQTAILHHTPNDAAKRFENVSTANAWHNSTKSPEVYSLRDDTSQRLAGLAWFSWQQHGILEAEYNATFAIRLYDSARGRHLSYPFAVDAHTDFEKQQEGKLTGLWLETAIENQPAQRLYRRLGYTVFSQLDNRLLMVKTTNDSL